MRPWPELLSEGEIFLRLLALADAPALLRLYMQNQAFFAPFDPFRPAHFFTLDATRRGIENAEEAARQDHSYSFGIFLTARDELIGRITLSNLIRGVFQNADLGYKLAQKYNGRGYMTQAVQRTVGFAFRDLRLHRVAAATLLDNAGSQRVLQKVGFRREGLAHRYLLINGRWQDHYLFALTADESGEEKASREEL